MKTDIDSGIVRTFDTFKGYGFIRRSKGKDVFVFFEDIVNQDRTLVEGDKVEFVVKKESKGPRAYEVNKIS